MPHDLQESQQERGAAPAPARVLVADPCGRATARFAVAAARAGGLGIVDASNAAEVEAVQATLEARGVSQWWLRPGSGLDPSAVAATALRPSTVVLSGADHDVDSLRASIDAWSGIAPEVVVQVVSRFEADLVAPAGGHGLIASGSEAGGRIGETEAFILFQQVIDGGLPVWVRGGIGLHTAAAAVAGGAVGVVLDAQLALVSEAKLDGELQQAIRAADGSETRVVGGHRFYTRPDLRAATLGADTNSTEVAALIGPNLRTQLVPFGQDCGFAAGLAKRFATVGGVVQAVQAAIDGHLVASAVHRPLAPGNGVAVAHGTRYPIVQGPMTRVSDRAEFAAAVASGGGLPFLALALLRGPEVRELLVQTRDLLGDRPWGVGVLGFVPAELRAEQLEVVHEIAPPVALIAGGRPSQAAPLEAAGIDTYLHVPSPGLLDRFLSDGARRFVFEGRECGGHVGPRSSFALWDAQIERLMTVSDPENLRVLLAGGIHDARSAAMAAAAVAPLVARGAQVGVLMGTAYVFTAECVDAGAIQPAFQDVAVAADTTVLLETAPGHATRCVETEFVRAFASRRDELIAQGREAKDRWAELETLNLGRLRIASKALVRDDEGLHTVDEAVQRREGMYMIGEVATLRDEVTTVEDLHRDVSEGGSALAGPAPTTSVVGPAREREADPLDIAIVGMDGFLPGATGIDEYWSEIVAGTDAVTEVSPQRWDVARYYDSDAFTKNAGVKTPSRWGGFIDAVGFDPLAYGIPPASLSAIEPVQLLSLEVASRALADAGYADREFDRGRASVIFGAESGNELAGAYGIRAFLPQLFDEIPAELDQWLPSLTEDSFPGVLANVIAGRIANRLDLGGVNYTVDAACASSLAALDAACKELRGGTSDLVLCGGADLHNGLNDYLLFASVHALSPSGRCRTFDASADGISLGEGIACVVLKRRVDAERDGDRIYAIVDAVAGSSDGRHLGLTAPRKEGQQRAVHRALEQSGYEFDTIGLVEAHGTGTVVGDRTEMATLTELFAEADVEPGSVVLGSVKSQIGHTKCAAGLAGLIKAAKAVYHGVLPPTANLVEPNPYYDVETSPFRFIDEARKWRGETRRAGISAFGFGGTNFHALISAHDGDDGPAFGLEQWPAELFLVRGDVEDLVATVAEIVASDPGEQRHCLRDLAAAVCRRGTGAVRAAVVARTFTELESQLRAVAAGKADPRAGIFLADPALAEADEPPTVAFLYPGQGSQRPGMTSDLFVTFGGLDDLLAAGEPWLDAMFPPTAFGVDQRAAQQSAITATDMAQPTLGIASMAITRLLRRVDVLPDLAGGHSYGELAALAAAGAFSDVDLLALSATRGGAILEAIEASGGDPGTMAAIELGRDEVLTALDAWPEVVLANHNGPKQVVISGPTEAVEEAAAAFEADGIRVKLLPVACAFHSPLISLATDRLAERLQLVETAPLGFPVWSNVTAEPYPADEPGAVARLLADQVTAGVRFVDQIESMYEHGARVFVEVGPGRVLTQQVPKILGDRPHVVVATDVAGEHGVHRLLLALAELAAMGVPVDPTSLFEGRTAPIDVASLPVPRPGWQIDGAFVRLADGSVLPNSLQPASTLPALDLGGISPMANGPADPNSVVLEYLRGVRELVAAERDVMLRYLGSEVAISPAAGPAPVTPIAATAQPAIEAAPAAPATAEAKELSGADLLKAVQAIVSERTGYPVEMLDPDLDLEADLSIDSIKRIEIVGELAERIGLGGLDESAVDEDMVEELASHKSLRGIVDWIEGLASGESSGPDASESQASPASGASPVSPASTAELPPSAQRFEVHTELLGPAVALGDLSGLDVAVVEGHEDLTKAVSAALAERGARLASLSAEVDVVVDLSTTLLDGGADARSVFAALQPSLLGAVRRVLGVTVPVHPDGSATGVAGLMRSVARERHDVAVRSVSLAATDLRGDLGPLAESLVDELLDLDAPVSLSWVGGQRSTQVVGEAQDLSIHGDLGLGPDAVVVVTGGARGITARVAEGLARANPCRIVLVGRSAFPDADEDPRTAIAQDRSALRRALLEIGELTTPHDIEVACNRIEADREMRESVAMLASFGATVEYRSLDVRSDEFGTLLDEIHATHGRLDGVIHGAGVLDDHFIRDKTNEGFDRVFGTKVEAARTILARTNLGLRFVIMFGSVSGVFGNRGQTDYAAANDALDELARATDGRDGCRVLTIDWGPWAGSGMVSPELEREYARRGIGVVDPDDGVMALLHELGAEAGPAQLLVMRGSAEAFAPPVEHAAVVD